ncbi:MAG: MerR family DNA-binding protein [Pseudomonadota bacterium]|jgi:MerR family copper efflux transcriptional regulator
MNIGQAARASGVSAKLIRYYEQIGLIQSTGRTDGNYRSFGAREVNELRFIRRARTVGYSVEHIRVLLSLWRDPTLSTDEIKTRADGHLADLERRIAEMRDMADTLLALSTETAIGVRPDFPISADTDPPRPTAQRKRSPK